MNRLTRTAVAMGGQLDVGKYLTGIRQFGLGAEASSMDFTTAVLPAYMKIMGEAKAGTALTSLQQVLLAPVPKTRSDRYQREQERIGLRDRTGSRELINAAGLKENAQDYFLTTLLPALNKAGFSTPSQIIEEIQRLLPRQTVDRLTGAGIMDRALIEKETNRNLAQQRAGDAPLAAMLANAPGAQFKGFAEGFRALEAVTTDAAMGPSMDIIRRLTISFQNMTDYVKAHPDDVRQAAQDVDTVIKMLLAAAGGVGKVWSYLPGPLKSAVIGGIAGSVVPGLGTAAGAGIGLGMGIGNALMNGREIAPPPGGWIPSRPGARPVGDGWTEEDLGLLHKQAYRTSGSAVQMQPIALTINLDGRVLSDTVTHHQTRAMSRPSPYGNSPDQLEVAPRPGTPLVAF